MYKKNTILVLLFFSTCSYSATLPIKNETGYDLFIQATGSNLWHGSLYIKSNGSDTLQSGFNTIDEINWNYSVPISARAGQKEIRSLTWEIIPKLGKYEIYIFSSLTLKPNGEFEFNKSTQKATLKQDRIIDVTDFN